MVLPLYSALWKTTLRHLMDSLKIENPIEIFRLYIETILDFKLRFFTVLSSDELMHCLNLRGNSNDSNAYWTVFVAEIENIYNNNPNSPLSSQNYDNTEIHCTSLTNSTSANNYVISYCAHKIIREKWITTYLFTPTSHQWISKLVAILTTDELLLFKIARAKNIYDYCTKLLIL